MTNPNLPSAEDEQAAKVVAATAKSGVATGKAVKAEPEKVINKAPAGSSRRRSEKARRKGPFIKYVGEASQRSIRPSDWRSLGISTNRADVWDITNDKMIETSKFSEAQLDYLLIDDFKADGGHSFLEVDYDSEGKLVQVIYEEEAK